MTQTEFETVLSDTSKRIDGDIEWAPDEDDSPSVEFRVEVASEAGYPLFVVGSYNAEAMALTFALIHRRVGRVYGLDMGKDHHNPSCNFVGDVHKHRWTEEFRDKDAYAPDDITASVQDPITVWQQFCRQAKITHNGRMQPPPPRQKELF